ncbi:MAG: ABC transporter ATP-binding protein [Firmicutes bacterium]|nr:ABC transporter ATP-binding protein [Bacillota bacterium]
MTTVIKLRQVSFAYNQRLILEDLNLEVREKDYLAVIGPNGGGKTTLVRLLLGSLVPKKGEIEVFGVSPKKARKWIGYVPQHGLFDQSFPVSALEVVLMGRLHPQAFFPRYSAADYLAAQEAMSALGIENLAGQRYGELSGGQKQRVILARALVADPKLLILDEPTASVDSRVEQDIYELLADLNKKLTIIIVSHDLGFVSTYVDQVACLNRKLAVHTVEEISADVVSGLYQSPVEMIEHRCAL